MRERRKGYWGSAVGLDSKGTTRRISVFETSGGFRFTDEKLHSGSSRSPSEDRIAADVAALYGLHNVRLELPHLGVYSRTRQTKPPTEPAETWGNLMKAMR
jgi:hypothetical protein